MRAVMIGARECPFAEKVTSEQCRAKVWRGEGSMRVMKGFLCVLALSFRSRP